MSTRSTISYWEEKPDGIGRIVHIYRELQDEWVYIEVETPHRPEHENYCWDRIQLRLFPDTPENRTTFGLPQR